MPRDPVKQRAKLARRNAEAKAIKLRLILKLGNKCQSFGCNATTNLTFDHKYGRDYAIEGLDLLGRYRRYEEEAQHGKLRLLCGPHNSSLGSKKMHSGFRADYNKQKNIKRKMKKFERVREFLRS